jgi:putative transport protein
VRALFNEGLRFNALAAAVVLLGAICAVASSVVGGIPLSAAVGLFAGATTNTPSLAAAQQVLETLPALEADTLKLPGLAYAVAYPFGILGSILSMVLVKRGFAIAIEQEAEQFDAVQQQQAHVPIWKDLMIENPNLDGLTLADIAFFQDMGVVITRILHGDTVTVASPNSKLHSGDTLRVVGQAESLEQLKLLIGSEAHVDLKQLASHLHSKRLVVTNKAAIGHTIGELCAVYGITISRIHRPDVEFTPVPSVSTQFGDELHAVGTQEALAALEKALGNSLETLNHPQVMPIFIGITLGILVGSVPLMLPGMPTALKLGMAGGPLLVAIVLSHIGNWGAMTWHLPKSSNIILKDIGIVLFLGCVGLYAGDQFIHTLTDGDGLCWMAWGIATTLLPLLIVAAVARYVMGLNYLSLCGLLAGSMTNAPALAYANALNPSAAVSMAYATVYPLVMIMRIITAQLIIVLLS